MAHRQNCRLGLRLLNDVRVIAAARNIPDAYVNAVARGGGVIGRPLVAGGVVTETGRWRRLVNRTASPESRKA